MGQNTREALTAKCMYASHAGTQGLAGFSNEPNA